MRSVMSWGWREIKKIQLRKKRITIGKGTYFNGATIFEGNNMINRSCHLYGTHVGIGTYMGDECVFNSTYIGRYCALGAGIRVSLGEHPIHKVVSIHPAFFSTKKQAGFTFCKQEVWKSKKQNEEKYGCMIGNDVWIGDEVTILGGVSIANGSVIGAGALVTRDTEPYGIYVGVPAKKIGSRFTEEEIDYLLKTKWWNWDMDILSSKAHLFDDIEEFKRNFEGYVNEDNF